MDTQPVSGIYGIWCSVTEKWYIGQSINIVARWHHHRYTLKSNAHKNVLLQRAWNKYGESSFLWVVLVRARGEELNDLECRFTDELQALSPSGFVFVAGGETRRVSAATRLKLSSAHKGKRASAETRLRQSLAHKGIPLSDVTKKRMAISQQRRAVRDKAAGISRGYWMLTPEQRARQAAKLVGHATSAITRMRISKTLSGRKVSAETRRRMAMAQLRKYDSYLDLNVV